MSNTWKFTSLVEGIVGSLLMTDMDVAIAEFINQVGEHEIASRLADETLIETVGEQFAPEQVFTEGELDAWARAQVGDWEWHRLTEMAYDDEDF